MLGVVEHNEEEEEEKIRRRRNRRLEDHLPGRRNRRAHMHSYVLVYIVLNIHSLEEDTRATPRCPRFSEKCFAHKYY